MSTISFTDIREAAARLAGVAHRTPVITSRRLSAELGLELFCKCENLQRAGSFKFRGAYHALSRLTDEARARGVVAFSSGNHAQGVAWPRVCGARRRPSSCRPTLPRKSSPPPAAT